MAPGQAHPDAARARDPRRRLPRARGAHGHGLGTGRHAIAIEPRPARASASRDRAGGRGVPTDDDNLVVRAARAVLPPEDGLRMTLTKVIPSAAGSAAARRTRPRCCGCCAMRYRARRRDGGPRRRPSSARTSRSACTAVPAWMRGRGEVLDPVRAAEDLHVVIATSRRSRSRPRRSTGRGTSSPARAAADRWPAAGGGRTSSTSSSTTSSRRPSGSSHGSRRSVTPSPGWPGPPADARRERLGVLDPVRGRRERGGRVEPTRRAATSSASTTFAGRVLRERTRVRQGAGPVSDPAGDAANASSSAASCASSCACACGAS